MVPIVLAGNTSDTQGFVLTLVFLIRHAPAIRPKGIIYGSLDYESKIADCAERVRLRSLVSNSGIWVSSSLRRARETAAALAADVGYDQEILVNANFNEQQFGDLEGAPRPKEVVAPYWLFASGVRPPGGESFDDVRFRVMAALDDLLEQWGHNGELVIFTHGNVIRAVLASVLCLSGDAPSRLSIGNWGVVSLLSGRDGFKVKL